MFGKFINSVKTEFSISRRIRQWRGLESRDFTWTEYAGVEPVT